MSFDFIEGFDYYPDAVGVPGVGVASTWIGSTLGWLMVAGRFDNKAIRSRDPVFPTFARRVLPESTKKVWGFALRAENLAAFQLGIGRRQCSFRTGTDVIQLEVWVNGLGVMRVISSGVVLGISTRAILDNTWHYIELEYLADVAAGRVRLMIDGAEQFEFAGPTAVNADPIGMCCLETQNNTALVSWDDMYMLSGVDNALGECRIQLLEATANDVVQFVPSAGTNYQNISESSVDSDVTYNAANDPGSTDYFVTTKITVNPDRIHAIGLTLAARKIDSGTRQIRSKIKPQLGAVINGLTNNLVTEYIWTRDVVELDSQGLPWTKASINSFKVGYELVL